MKIWQLICLGILPISAFVDTKAISQIIPDQTLPNNSFVISPDGQTLLINGGTQAGNNLFHSFQEFNVNTGQFILFNNGLDITNIFSRVTGSNISVIDGTLATNGSANLFLINPNGITFKKNAQLLLGGSFWGTTASQVTFADGGRFNANNPRASILTISVPMGLEFHAQQNALIRVEGAGHNLIYNNLNAPISPINPQFQGLAISPTKILGLFSNSIEFDGGIVRGLSGNIVLGAVHNGIVNLESLSIDGRLGSLNLSNKSAVLSYGVLNYPSTISLMGDVKIDNGSLILSQSLVNQTQRGRISTWGNLIIEGEKNGFPSLIRNAQLGTGNRLDIWLKGDSLVVTGGGGVQSVSFSDGNLGEIQLSFSEITLRGISEDFTNLVSGVGLTLLGSGNSGDLVVNTKELRILDGAAIATVNFAEGRAGNIRINADDVSIVGIEVGATGTAIPSTISSLTAGSTPSADILINTERLNLSFSGGITTTSFSSGDSGKVTINASESVIIRGIQENSNFANRPSLDSNTAVFASNLPISGVDRISGMIFSGVFFPLGTLEELIPEESLTGESGSITINTPRFEMVDNGILVVSNEGRGAAGNLVINAENLRVDQSSLIADTASGQGGNVIFNGKSISFDNAVVTATAGGLGNGGNIRISSDVLFVLGNSQIIANAFAGNGGNITINSPVVFQDPSSVITASSELGVDGTVAINNEFNLQDLVFATPVQAPIVPVPLEISCEEVELFDGSGNLDAQTINQDQLVGRYVPRGEHKLPANRVDIVDGEWRTVRDLTLAEVKSLNCIFTQKDLKTKE